ncbi:MAG: hypothetical protein ABI947_19955 [Chloroflexota bacterium]
MSGMLSLKERFETAQAEYDVLKQRCESQAVRWEWVDGFLYRPEPFFHEREQFSRGRVIPREPKNNLERATFAQYGFNKDNQLVVVRYNQAFGKVVELFYVQNGAVTEGTRYDVDHKLINVNRQYFVDDHIVRYEVLAQPPFSEPRWSKIENYHYTNGKLARIEGSNSRFEITYSKRGVLHTIAGYYGVNGQRLVYRRPRKEETQKALGERLHKAFVQLIPKALANVEITEPVFNVTLCYSVASVGWDFFPPTLGVIYESDRQETIAKRQSLAGYLWNPHNFYNGDVADLWGLLDDDLREACRLLGQEMGLSSRGCTFGQKLLRRVARDLADFNWSTIFSIMPDFVIYPYLNEGASHVEFMRDFSASVPQERIAQFQENGYFYR